MTTDQMILFGILVVVFGLLIWGRWRYDLVAFGALLVTVIFGLVPIDNAFSGFGHPATVIIALVLIVSRGLSNSGAIELIARWVIDGSRSLALHISYISGIGAVLSAVMNNVGALALLMPVDIEAAKKSGRSPASTLMPLSFATILGGLVTLIGTPPNIIVASYRESALGAPFEMFDFTPVGAVAAITGILFIATIGWRLIPAERTKKNSAEDLFKLEGYIAEVEVSEESVILDQLVRDLDSKAEEHDVAVVGLIRNGKRFPGAARLQSIRKGDVLVLEANPKSIESFVGEMKLKFSGQETQNELISGSELSLVEVVVPQGARIEGRSAQSVRLLTRRGVTLLGVSRQGRSFRDRVRKLNIRSGDVLLLLGQNDRLPDVVDWLGCLPLAERGLKVFNRRTAGIAVGIFAVAILLASFGILYLPIALAAAGLAMVLLNIVPAREIYNSIEWPVIVLLGSMIPIGTALEASGGTQLIAESIVTVSQGQSPLFVLTILMIVTMTLSDVLNNTATTVIAAPIALDIANKLGVNPDPFLMAVAIAASCAFLTPIGHKNNTLIMGPGGYKFGDYWRMGLPLEILVVAVSIPMLAWIWPL
ncbi:MAG: SLC13 family permease [Methyloligellaceae bacterium]